MGGFDRAVGSEVYGSLLLAMGDIHFSARANGIKGASMISNGKTFGTSNMSMDFCNVGVDVFTADYFQMVE